jgi:hypothetical protein
MLIMFVSMHFACLADNRRIVREFVHVDEF